MMNMLQTIRSRFNQPDKIPKGFMTAQQWAKKWNMSDNHARKLLYHGVQQKVVKRIYLKVWTGVGVRPAPHFGRAKPGKPV